MANYNSSDFIDVGAYLRLYLKKWYLFVISVVLCVACAWLYTKVKPEKYQVLANIVVQDEEANPMSMLSGGLSGLFGSQGKVEDEIFVISSHSLYRELVKELGINQIHRVKHGFLNSPLTYPDIPLEVITAPALPDTLRYTVKFKVNVNKDGVASIKAKVKRRTIAEVKDVKLPVTLQTEYGDYTIDKTQYFVPGEPLVDKITYKGYDAAAEDIAEEITSDIGSKKSNVIKLGIKTTNPDYGKAILDQLIADYNRRGIQEKNLQGEKTAKFIEDRLYILSGDLAEAETNIQRYKEQHKLTDLEADALYQTTKKSEVEKQLLAAETQAEIIKMTRDFMADPKNAYNLVPAALDNPGLLKAIETYNEIVLQRIDMLNNAKPGNLALRQIEEQIDAMRSNLITSVQKAYESANITVRDLRAEKAASDALLGKVPSQEREYIDLKRNQVVKQTLVEFLLERQEETSMMLANAVPKGSIVDPAYTRNKPIGMSRMMKLLLGFIIGLFITPIYLYLRKNLRNKFESREEAEKELTPPIIGEMCVNKSGEKLAVAAHSTTSVTELFRLMRTNLQFILNNPNDKVVLMTSSRSGEGKSFISINLAASLALLDNKRVLLIGMDIRKPQLANYLNIPANPGLTQYLTGNEYTLDDIIQRDAIMPNLDIIVAGPIPPNPAEILASDRLDNMMDELRSRYDYIIIDSAPVGMVSDSFTLNRISDATIYVTRVNYTSRADLKFINEIYERNRLKKLSVIINGTSSRQGYGYGYKK